MTTWYASTTIRTLGVGVNTAQALLVELNAFFTDCANEGASFRWQVASYQSTAPFYLVLKRKDGSAGRLMFFGGNSGSTPASAALITSLTGNVDCCYVTWDPTATTDTPPNNYTSANPWSAANSRGRPMTRHFTQLLAHRMRAYCSDDGQLFLHAAVANTASLYGMHVGPIFRAASGGSTNYEGLAVQFGNGGNGTLYVVDGHPSSYTNGGSQGPADISFGCPDLAANGITSLSTTRGYCSAYIGGTWYQVNRATGQRFTAGGMTDPANRMHFLPVLWVTAPDQSTPTPSVLKSKNLGIGPCRTRDWTWVDNAAVTRGYYLGYHGTQGSDLTALSILNDDI